MTVSSLTIEPIKDLKNWYRLTFTSRKDGIGETKTELLISEEILRKIRKEADKLLPPLQTNDEIMPFMGKDK